MNCYSTLQRGYKHPHFCEDFLGLYSLKIQEKEAAIGIVSDGCSGGIDAHLAATLTCKLIRKVVNKGDFKGKTAEELGLEIARTFIQELSAAQQHLQLTSNELLATLLLLVHYENQAFITVLGDGVVCIEEQIQELDHNNQPDYPIYHIQDDAAALEQYLTQQSFVVENPQNIAIATDGILSFRNPKKPLEDSKDFVVNYLMQDDSLMKSKLMLNRKCNILRTQHELTPADDLAIVRITNDYLITN